MESSNLPPYALKSLFGLVTNQPSLFGQIYQSGLTIDEMDKRERASDMELTEEQELYQQIEKDLAEQAKKEAEEEAKVEGRARTKTVPVPVPIPVPEKKVNYGQEGDLILDVDGLLAELQANKKNKWFFKEYSDILTGDDLRAISKILEENVLKIKWQPPTIVDPASFEYVDTDSIQYTFRGRSPFFQKFYTYGITKSDAKTSFEFKGYEPGIVVHSGVPHVRVRRLLKRNNTEYVVDEPATLHPDAEKQAKSAEQPQIKQQRKSKKQREQATLEESKSDADSDADEDYVPSDVEQEDESVSDVEQEDESASAEDESSSESSPAKKRAKSGGKRGTTRRREKHVESTTSAAVATLDQPLKIGDVALAYLKDFLNPSAQRKLEYATVFGADATSVAAKRQVPAKSRAAQTSRPASRTAVASSATTVAVKDTSASIPRVAAVEPAKSPKSQKILDCVGLGKDYINSRMSRYNIYNMDPKTGKELDDRGKCKKIVEHEEKRAYETQNASTSTRK